MVTEVAQRHTVSNYQGRVSETERAAELNITEKSKKIFGLKKVVYRDHKINSNLLETSSIKRLGPKSGCK